jgi:hypothetical protein
LDCRGKIHDPTKRIGDNSEQLVINESERRARLLAVRKSTPPPRSKFGPHLRKAELACGKSLDKSALALRLFRESHWKCKRPLEKRQAREQIKVSHQKLKAAKKNGAVESVAPVSNDDRELVHFDYQEARSLATEIAEKLAQSPHR